MKVKNLYHLKTIVLGGVLAMLSGCSDHSTLLGPGAVLLGVGNQSQPTPSDVAAVGTAAPQIDGHGSTTAIASSHSTISVNRPAR